MGWVDGWLRGKKFRQEDQIPEKCQALKWAQMKAQMRMVEILKKDRFE